MPRPLCAGAISFGLVTIPVKVVSATEDHDVHFHRVHLADMGRVRTRKVCELDDQVVSQDEIGKGYEIAKGQTVPVTDEELEQMPLPTAKAIEIAAFTDADTVDPVRISDSYYLAADGQVAAKPYALLRKALERSSKVAKTTKKAATKKRSACWLSCSLWPASQQNQGTALPLPS